MPPTLSAYQLIFNEFIAVLKLYPVLVAFASLSVLLEQWMRYIRLKFIAKQGEILLEISFRARSPSRLWPCEIFFWRHCGKKVRPLFMTPI